MTNDSTPEGIPGTRPIARVYLEGEYTVELPGGLDLNDEQALGAAVEESIAEISPAELGSAVRIVNYEVGTIDASGQFEEEPR